tara:strand:+ start:817 stop:1089 length:273 start_codon:yes stop_codon:yes gene_type:complete
MSYFKHKNDKIEIDGYIFNETVLKEFDPDYSKPDGWIRIYIPQKKHCFTNGMNQIGSDFPWKDGDRYIKSLKELQFLEKQLKLDKEYNGS